MVGIEKGVNKVRCDVRERKERKGKTNEATMKRRKERRKDEVLRREKSWWTRFRKEIKSEEGKKRSEKREKGSKERMMKRKNERKNDGRDKNK